jgi:hypothetical protein
MQAVLLSFRRLSLFISWPWKFEVGSIAEMLRLHSAHNTVSLHRI